MYMGFVVSLVACVNAQRFSQKLFYDRFEWLIRGEVNTSESVV